MFRDIFKFLASLQMAIVLLIVIIIATAFGTYYETSFNAEVAQKNIYSHWWFNIWLGALCVNLFCVAAIRYPWKRHQTGFVITHAGIITLLCGAMIDRMWGIEGFMHLKTTRQGTNVMELHRERLSVKIDGKTADNFIKVDTIFNPQPLQSPLPEVKVGISNVQPVQGMEVAAPAAADDPNAKPGLNVTLQGPMMGRNDASVFFNESEAMGPAKILFVPGVPKLSATPEDGKDQGADLNLDFQGRSFTFLVKYGEEKEENLEGCPGWKIIIKGYYPNLIMDGKRPSTRNLIPSNPAVSFELVGPEVHGVNLKEDPRHEGLPGPKQDPDLVAPQREGFFVFAKDAPIMNAAIHGPGTGASATLAVHTPPSSASLIKGPNGLAFFLGDDGKLRYFLKARDRNANAAPGEEGKSIEKTGDVELEKPIAIGWGAPGTECVVHDFIVNAQHKLAYLPHPERRGKDKDEEGETLGVECEVTVGNEAKKIWIGHTLVEEPFPQEFVVGGKKVNFEFVNQTVTLPFTVKLREFRAPRDEGSVEIAAFQSDLLFKNMECAVTLRRRFLHLPIVHGSHARAGQPEL